MSAAGQPLSVPARTGIPRPMTDLEAATLRRVADTLVPARGDIPAASAEPGFADRMALALDARSDAFESICAALGTLAPVAQDNLFGRLRDLSVTEPESFQALSTVIARGVAADIRRAGAHRLPWSPIGQGRPRRGDRGPR
jgi:hypothetical protein